MRIGLALPHYDFSAPDGGPVSHGRVVEAARTAERQGFDSVWISDHFFLSLERYGGSPGPQGSLEPLTTLAALAVSTERIRLGTLVLCAPFRHPGLVAKMAAAVDLYSGGRLDLGVGAGWYGEEFDAFGYEFQETGDRFSALEETLAVLGLLFGEEPADFDGRHYRLRGASNRPRAVQRPRPPLGLGAKGGERSLRLAARHADGWNTVWRWEVGDYREAVGRARRACEAVGRDPATLRLSVGLYSLVGEDRADLDDRYERLRRWAPGGALDDISLEEYARGGLVGTPDRALQTLSAFAAIGVEEVIVAPASLPFAVPDPGMLEVVAAHVIPAARAL